MEYINIITDTAAVIVGGLVLAWLGIVIFFRSLR
jgi:hypothetical protein